MTEAADIDWETINAKLPYERSAEAKEQRRELFKQFDPNSNGYLSLAEVIFCFQGIYCDHFLTLILCGLGLYFKLLSLGR